MKHKLFASQTCTQVDVFVLGSNTYVESALQSRQKSWPWVCTRNIESCVLCPYHSRFSLMPSKSHQSCTVSIVTSTDLLSLASLSHQLTLPRIGRRQQKQTTRYLRYLGRQVPCIMRQYPSGFFAFPEKSVFSLGQFPHHPSRLIFSVLRPVLLLLVWSQFTSIPLILSSHFRRLWFLHLIALPTFLTDTPGQYHDL